VENFLKDKLMQNKFKIITPSYNNENWVEYNIASILNQTYTNYEVLYIDDASTDSTYDRVLELVKDLNNWTIVKNKENKGATSNYFDNLDRYIKNDNEIIVHLDGDDWFYDENVLDKLNDFYNTKNCWMTYGGFLCFDGTEQAGVPYPQSTEYSDFIHRHKIYRRDDWRASHMRTYRSFLMNAFNKEDLKSLIDGKYYWHASDLAFQFSFLEMCPKEKIGVVDFYTYVYNQTKSNTSRTREREDQSNSKYEIEIRNRKHYKEGLTAEKFDQVNIYPIAYYHELYDMPTKFTYCYEQRTGEFDMTLLCDHAVKDYILGKLEVDKNKPVVARLLEHKGYFENEIHNLVLNNYDKFDLILTFDKVLLESIPNAKLLPPLLVTHFSCLPNPIGIPPSKSKYIDTYELPDDVFQIYKKSKLVSAISSNKAFLPGHRNRLEFINSIRNRVDLYGRGMGVELDSKLDGLRDYMFSVAIENVENDDYYFTEKITECFLTGTIPIYHGCLNIGKFFDTRGILYFKNMKELHGIMDSLTPKKYQEMMPYIKSNFEACFKWPVNNDTLYEKYYKNIIEKKDIIIHI
jgi:glycosyltransferase involved in cell wall biosynthesis